MKNLFKPLRGDYCHKCNSHRVIECYNRFDKPINYSYFLDEIERGNMKVIEKLDNHQIEYMVCRKCKEQYFIDWRTTYPIPVRDFFIVEVFLDSIYN